MCQTPWTMGVRAAKSVPTVSPSAFRSHQAERSSGSPEPLSRGPGSVTSIDTGRNGLVHGVVMLHQAVTGREADGIRDQIPDHLLETVGIPKNRSGRRLQQHLQPNAFGFRGRPDRRNGLLDGHPQVDRPDVEPHFAGDDA